MDLARRPTDVATIGDPVFVDPIVERGRMRPDRPSPTIREYPPAGRRVSLHVRGDKREVGPRVGSVDERDAERRDPGRQ